VKGEGKSEKKRDALTEKSGNLERKCMQRVQGLSNTERKEERLN
jgi:hypothetical protein